MIAYETPDFAGFKLFTQYGMGSNDNENESSSNRFYSLGVTYNNGPFAGYFAVDSINYITAKFSKGEWPNNGDDIDDSLTVTLGGSYDFDVVKIYLGAQYSMKSVCLRWAVLSAEPMMSEILVSAASIYPSTILQS